MSKPISLKRRLEAMNTGDVIVTDVARNGVYVAAKRAGVKVSTVELPDFQIEVTCVAKLVKVPEPKISQFDATLEIVSNWTTTTRLAFFENFELCCGMKRGQCVCPDDVISHNLFVGKWEKHPERANVARDIPVGATIPDIPMNAAMAKFLASQNGEPQHIVTSEIVDDWRFTKDKPNYPDDGRAYRQQILHPAGKRFRTVEVDIDNIETILRVC